VAAIRRSGGKLVCVERGAPPEWLACALQTVHTAEDDQWIISDQQRDMASQYPDIHPSEWAWLGTTFDRVIDNNSTIEHLYQQVKNLAESD
jgi:alkyl hydroperoxide reductase subunit AhpC